MEGALKDLVQFLRHRKLDHLEEANPVSGTGQALTALSCSPAPEGHDHWNLRLLADRMVELGVVESLSHEAVRLHLKKRPQAVAEERVVHSQGERRLCGSHGGRAGPRIQYGAGSVRRAL